MMKVLLVIILGILIQAIIAMDYNTNDSLDGNITIQMENEESEVREGQKLVSAFGTFIAKIARVVQDMQDLKTSYHQNEKVMEIETKLDAVASEIDSLKTSDQQPERMIEDNIQRLEAISPRGRWCGHGISVSHIAYDLTFGGISFDTNMPLSGVPLDLITGNLLKLEFKKY